MSDPINLANYQLFHDPYAEDKDLKETPLGKGLKELMEDGTIGTTYKPLTIAYFEECVDKMVACYSSTIKTESEYNRVKAPFKNN